MLEWSSLQCCFGDVTLRGLKTCGSVAHDNVAHDDRGVSIKFPTRGSCNLPLSVRKHGDAWRIVFTKGILYHSSTMQYPEVAGGDRIHQSGAGISRIT